MHNVSIKPKDRGVRSGNCGVRLARLRRARCDQSSHGLTVQMHSDSNHFSWTAAVIAVELLWQNQWRSLGEPTTYEMSAQQLNVGSERRQQLPQRRAHGRINRGALKEDREKMDGHPIIDRRQKSILVDALSTSDYGII